MAEEKTNVMRVLDQKKIPYTPHWYAHPDGAVDGVSVAALIGKEPGAVCKTLVTQGASKKYYVFVIPAEKELDLKAAARAAGESSTWAPIFPALTTMASRPSALWSKKVGKSFFIPTGEQPPWT